MIERLLALAVLAASGTYLVNGMSLPLGTAARPGPGFFPLVVGVFGAAVALVWTVIAVRRAPPAVSAAAVAPEGRRRVRMTVALLAGYCLFLPWAGFPLVALGFVGFLLRWLGGRWTEAWVIALVSALGSYYLFGALLGVPLPRGVLFD